MTLLNAGFIDMRTQSTQKISLDLSKSCVQANGFLKNSYLSTWQHVCSYTAKPYLLLLTSVLWPFLDF